MIGYYSFFTTCKITPITLRAQYDILGKMRAATPTLLPEKLLKNEYFTLSEIVIILHIRFKDRTACKTLTKYNILFPNTL